MKVRVLFFAGVAQAVGCRSIELDVSPGATVEDVLCALRARFAEDRTVFDNVATALDAEYAPPDATVRDGCTVAIIPPVSGG